MIQQRSETVKNPLVWSATGGSVVAGEDSYTGAIREVKEELGLDLTEDMIRTLMLCKKMIDKKGE